MSIFLFTFCFYSCTIHTQAVVRQIKMGWDFDNKKNNIQIVIIFTVVPSEGML